MNNKHGWYDDEAMKKTYAALGIEEAAYRRLGATAEVSFMYIARQAISKATGLEEEVVEPCPGCGSKLGPCDNCSCVRP